jgi:hypothetical protein
MTSGHTPDVGAELKINLEGQHEPRGSSGRLGGQEAGMEPVREGGLLDISTARYFYKVSKTILHKPTANSGVNIFFNKCSYKHYLQLL